MTLENSASVTSSQPSNAMGDVISLARLAWRSRWAILTTAVACAVVMGIYAYTAKPWYRAQVTLLPVENKSTQGLLGQLGPLSGLAGLAGISIDSRSKSEPLAVLRSRDFARDFIENHQLLTVLFADKWDARKRIWNTSPDKAPDIRDAIKFFDEEVRRIGEDRKLGLVILTVDWHDPQLASNWANQMAAEINAQLRQDAIEDAEKSIQYLRGQLASSGEVSLQQSIGRLLESQMQTLMVARGNEEYAFRVIDQAYAPKRRFKPHRSLLVLGGGVIGGLLALAWLGIRAQWRRSSRS